MQNVQKLFSGELPHVESVVAQIPHTITPDISIDYSRIALKKNSAPGLELKYSEFVAYEGCEFQEITEKTAKTSAPLQDELFEAFKPLALHYCIAMRKIDKRFYCSLNALVFDETFANQGYYCNVEQKQHTDLEMEVFTNCEALGITFKGGDVIIEVLWADLSNEKEAAEKSTTINEKYPYFADLTLVCEKIVFLAHKYFFKGDYKLENIQLSIPNDVIEDE